jgi:hypothetical protein
MRDHDFAHELAAARLPPICLLGELVGSDEMALFTGPLARYFQFMKVVGRPRVSSFRCYWTGRFRLAPETGFKRCEAWQYNAADPIARLFRLRIRMAPLVSVVAHDRYLHGRGRLTAKLYDRLTLADADGSELDVGELVTWLNDAVLIAPSMLLGANVRLAPVDQHGFDVSLTDAGRTVSARVFLDERGAPVDFRTTDRFVQDPADREKRWQRCEWRTPIGGWTEANGHPIPVSGRATWMLPGGPFTYVELDLDPDSLAFNVQPILTGRSNRG